MSKFIPNFRCLLVIICASLLSACSALKLAYNQAPDLGYWWLDGYFDFTDAQTPKVRDELAKLFAWHRKNELPKTAELLAKTAAQMNGEISAEQACKTYGEIRVLIDNITTQALPAMAEIAPTFTPDQIAHLKGKYSKNSEQFTRDYISGTAASRSDRDSKRMKSAVERSERLYGKLEDKQLAAVAQAIGQSSFDAAYTLKERQRRQQELIGIFAQLAVNKASQQASEQALQGYIQRAWQSPDLAYRSYTQRLTQEGCASFASVHASTTPAQRAHAERVLKGYEGDLRVLAAQR